MWRAMAAFVLVLPVAVVLRAEGNAPSVSVSGRWMRPVGQELGICEGGLAGWGWNYSGDNESSMLVRIDITGHKRSWRLPAVIRRIRFTRDCSNVWIITGDWKHLYALNADADAEPVGLQQPLSREIGSIYPSEDGQHAWIRFEAVPQLMLAMRTPRDVQVTPINGDENIEINDITRADGAKGLWVEPSDDGVFLAAAHGYREIERLHGCDIEQISTSRDETVAWMVPRHRAELGVYVVDVLHDSVTLELPKVSVYNVATRGNVAWVQSLDDRLYAFRTGRTVTGAIQMEPLNGGLPISIHGTEMLVGNVYPVGDGTHAWLGPTGKHAAYQLWDTVWHAHVRADGTIEVIELDPGTHFNKPLRSFFLDQRNPEHLWIRSYDLRIYDTHVGAKQPSQPVFPTSMQIDSLVASSLPNRLWAATSSFITYVTGPGTDVKATVRLGDDELTFPAAGRLLLHGTPWKSKAEIKLQGPAAFMRQTPGEKIDLGAMIANDIHPAASVTFAMRQKHGDHSATIAEGSGMPDDQGKVSLEMLGGGSVDYSLPVDVEVTYRDDWNSDVRILWRDVKLNTTLWQRIQASPLFRAALFILLPISLLCLVLRQDASLRRWSPIFVPLLEATSARLWPDVMTLGWTDVVVAAGVVLVVTLAVALSSPRMFRTIATLEPMARAVPLVMRLRRVRSLVYRDYVAWLRRRILALRVKAEREQYVAIPVTVTDSGMKTPPANPSISAEEIIDVLSDSGTPCNVLIEGPGGRGKSALLHELLERALDRFGRDALKPLPVIAESSEEDIIDMTVHGLGKYALSPQHARTAAATGEFIIFMDSWSEAGRRAMLLDRYFFGSSPSGSPVCITSRPDGELETAIAKTEEWLIVEPNRLDKRNVYNFIDEYAKHDAARRRIDEKEHVSQVQEHMERLLPIIRSNDATYLPLLVRFGMLLDSSVETVADVFNLTMQRLLERDPVEQDRTQLFTIARELAYKSYFENRERVVVVAEVPQHQPSIDRLIAVGLLMPDKGVSQTVRKPSRLRFLHDSLQSYLAAHYLAASQLWDDLLVTAGDPAFRHATSDLATSQSSELYQMCLFTFRPAWRLRERLVQELTTWQRFMFSAFALEHLLAAMTSDVADELRPWIVTSASPAAVLQKAIDLVESRDRVEESVERTGKLYGALAPKMWPRRNELAKRIADAID